MGAHVQTRVIFNKLDGPDRDDCDPDHVPDLLLTSAQKSLRKSTPLDSLYASLEREATRWHTCRSRWLKRQQALRDLSSGCHSFYKQSLDSRLVAGLGPGPIALTVNLALSMVAGLRPVLSLANLNLDESQVLSAWRFARQMPRPGIRARLLKRLREHVDSCGWPVPGRRMVSVPPEVSLDVTKQFFMENLLVLKQLNFPCWRWLSESTIFYHSSRRTCADECWTMIRDAKTFTLSNTEETGDASLSGAHKDSRH